MEAVELLQGRYSIQETIAKGGMGVAFLARDIKKANRRCLIKQFHLSKENIEYQSVLLPYFQKEASTLKRLGNAVERIPKMYDYFEADGEYYLVQEFIEGQTLQKRVELDGPFNESQVRRFLLDFLDTIAKIHRHEILHRDINPRNIILRKGDSAPILIDFGIVKEIATRLLGQDDDALTSTRIGTPGYCPPEQIMGKGVFSCSDLYSLGVTVVYMLTGKSPQSFPLNGEGIYQWKQFCPKISSGFESLINKAIEFDYKKRYQSADEMLQALRELTTIKTSKPSPPPVGNVLVVEAREGKWKESTKTVDPQNATLPANSLIAKLTGFNRNAPVWAYVLGSVIALVIGILIVSIAFKLMGINISSQQENGNVQATKLENKNNRTESTKNEDAEPPKTKVTHISPADVKGPSAVYKKIERAQPAAQQTVIEDFNGYPVNWTLSFISMSNVKGKKDIVELELRESSSEDYNAIGFNGPPTVICTVRLPDCPRLAWIEKGTRIPVQGKISIIGGIGNYQQNFIRRLTLDPVQFGASFCKVDR